MASMKYIIYFLLFLSQSAFCMDEAMEKEFGITDVAPFKSCENLKFGQLEISVWGLVSSMADEESNPRYKLYAMNRYNLICLQAKCLMKRDKLSYKELVKKITATGSTPVMKRQLADTIKKMDLETCSQ